jgi:ankyrin repeat protein
VRDAFGLTPLLYAASQPRVTRGSVSGVAVAHEMEPSREVIQLLLDAGADIDSATNAGNTALHSAAARGYPNVVRLLVSRGADPHRWNVNGHTPEDLAVRLAELARKDVGASLRAESVLSTLRSARAATLPAVAPAPGNAAR